MFQTDAELRGVVFDLVAKVETLEARMDEIKRPGPPAKKLLSTEVGVCGLDPDCDSAMCTEGNLYRHQQGCRGTKCVAENQAYYRAYRAEKKKGGENGTETHE